MNGREGERSSMGPCKTCMPLNYWLCCPSVCSRGTSPCLMAEPRASLSSPDAPGNSHSFLPRCSRAQTRGASFPSAIAEKKFPFDAAPHQTSWAGGFLLPPPPPHPTMTTVPSSTFDPSYQGCTADFWHFPAIRLQAQRYYFSALINTPNNNRENQLLSGEKNISGDYLLRVNSCKRRR